MISEELKKAREYEEQAEKAISESERPVYHLTARTGWLNDPNGFSFFGGKYHLFYQYYPYESKWGPMHWGHVVSSDMIKWEYLPAALAPDSEYDRSGCFSGSSVTMPNGKQMIMYTGCSEDPSDEKGRWKQQQCIAIGDGTDYEKCEDNPVITEDDLPDGADPHEFRDPYLWKVGSGRYRAVIANANDKNGGTTQMCLYKSDDAMHWRRESVLFEDSLKTGIMWECPNFFRIGSHFVLMACPMDMEMEAEEAEGSVRFPKGNNECYMTGLFDEYTGEFVPQTSEDFNPLYYPVDCGLDFYAAQVLAAPDNRYIMIAWMQDPENSRNVDPSRKIYGQLTCPRELFIKQGKLCQKPIRELAEYRGQETHYDHVSLNGETELDGISGRVADIILRLRPEAITTDTDARELSYNRFSIRFAGDKDVYTEFSYDPHSSTVTIDRTKSVPGKTVSGSRKTKVRNRDGSIDLRILLDRNSAEIFINDGEQVITTTLETPQDYKGISFLCSGKAIMNISKYELEK